MKVSQSMPYVGDEEYDAIKECFDANWLTEGPKAKEFTDKICQMIGTKYGVLAPNGTLALYLGLRALGIGPGDEVIVPDFTFIASATAVCMAGATPVFVDIKREDLQINIKECHRAGIITERTKAVMPVHLFGQACNMDDVKKFAERYKLFVIEDACQALGVKWNGKPAGSFGDVGCFSFFADKAITTVEGGFIATDNEEIYKKLFLMRNQGRYGGRGTFIHDEVGFNFRMTDVQAAIGLEQLKKADYIFQKRYEKYEMFCKYLKGVKKIKIMHPQSGSNYVPFRVIVFCDGDQQDLSDYMKDRGIEARTVFFPLHKQPCFSYLQLDDVHYGNANWVFNHGLCLPAYPQLTEEQIKYVCDVIKEYYHV